MNTENFNEIILEQIATSKDMLIKKSGEYATELDRLHNFRQAAHLNGETMAKALGGMMIKHTVSIYDMINNPDTSYPMDVWTEKITDHINYLLLLGAVVVAEKREAKEIEEVPENEELEAELEETKAELARVKDALNLANLKRQLETGEPIIEPSEPTKVLEIPIVSVGEDEEPPEDTQKKTLVTESVEPSTPLKYQRYHDDASAGSIPSFLQDNTQTDRINQI